jgi:hypothetical protein
VFFPPGNNDNSINGPRIDASLVGNALVLDPAALLADVPGVEAALASAPAGVSLVDWATPGIVGWSPFATYTGANGDDSAAPNLPSFTRFLGSNKQVVA